MNVAPQALSWVFACLLLLFDKDFFKLTIEISMRKVILEVEYFVKRMIYQMLNFFQKNSLFHPEMILRPLFCFQDTKNIGNFLKQKKLTFNFFVDHNWKKLTGSRKRAKILVDNR